jgi:hypothetical protein
MKQLHFYLMTHQQQVELHKKTLLIKPQTQHHSQIKKNVQELTITALMCHHLISEGQWNPIKELQGYQLG